MKNEDILDAEMYFYRMTQCSMLLLFLHSSLWEENPQNLFLIRNHENYLSSSEFYV